jgi:hypothetical protein
MAAPAGSAAHLAPPPVVRPRPWVPPDGVETSGVEHVENIALAVYTVKPEWER